MNEKDVKPDQTIIPVLQKHAAPATAAGFLFQFRRAVQVLATAANGTVLGIETLDDLETENPLKERTLEQDKFTSQMNAPVFGDGSRNLLGTLSTWLAALLSGEVSLATTRFLLVTNAVCRGGLVRKIANASTEDEARRCVAEIRAMESSSEIKHQLREMLADQQGENMLAGLCRNVELVDGANTSEGDAMNSLPIPSNLEIRRASVFDERCGWIQSEALRVWEKGEPCRIRKQTFTNKLQAIFGQLERERRRERPASEIPISAEAVEGEQGAVFVRQIDLVTNDESYKTDAICDFLRCVSEKTRLNGEGEISDGDWRDFENRLKERGKDIWRRNNRLSSGKSEEDTGFRTMTEVLDRDHHPDLAGEPTTQTYLANGTYHSLSDEKIIGWHPRYLELLGNGEPDGHPL